MNIVTYRAECSLLLTGQNVLVSILLIILRETAVVDSVALSCSEGGKLFLQFLIFFCCHKVKVPEKGITQ